MLNRLKPRTKMARHKMRKTRANVQTAIVTGMVTTGIETGDIVTGAETRRGTKMWMVM
jgi:hypothetical protein